MNLKNSYPAIVVGAGPAGSAAALTLAKNGIETLLIEKQREVGKDIFCAEGISVNTLNLTKNIFGIENPEKFIASKIDTLRIIAPDLDYFEVYKDDMSVVLERKIFDRTLAEKAAAAGAELSVSTKFLRAERDNGRIKIEVLKDGKVHEIFTDLLIGADGPGSAVATSLGLNMEVSEQDVHKCAQFLVYDEKIPSNRMDFLFSEKYSPTGYAWVFPKGRGLANLGVGVTVETNKDPMDYLKTIISEFYPNARIIGWLRGVVPVGGNLKKIYTDNLLVVGDAARLADPATGGGIATAIISGKIAGEVGAEAIKKDDLSEKFLKKYEKNYWNEIGLDYKISLILKDYLKNYTDERIIKLYRVLKKLFAGKNLQTLNLSELFFNSVKNSKEILSLLLGSGGDVVNSLRKVIF